MLPLFSRRRAVPPSISPRACRSIDVSTGWFDAGIVDGKNKLVPTIAFTLKNVSDQKLVVLQVNAVFRRVNDPNEWGAVFLTVAGSEGLRSRVPRRQR